MGVVRFTPRRPLPRVEIRQDDAPRRMQQLEVGLLELALQLDRLPWVGNERSVERHIRLAAEIGAFEVLVLLRDLRGAIDAEDIPAEAALRARIELQLEADLEYVLALEDPTGQFDI
ncbi:MAG: hypothetical protein AAGJ34_02160 [Pseudomonadota bacterium]